MIWSPSTSLPSWSTARQRSASPSWAMPRSAPCSTTARLSGPRWVEPTPSLMLRPSGSAPMTMTSAPASVNTCGEQPLAAPWAQSSTTFRPSRRCGRVPEQVHDVAVLGVGEALDAAHVAAHGPEGLLAELRLDGVLDLVGQLLAAAGEELDAVVRRRVVRGGDHHAEVGVEVGHQEGGGRGGEDAGVVDVDPGAGEPGLHGGGDELAAGPGVAGDHGARPVAGRYCGHGQVRRRRPGPAATRARR